MEIIKKYLWNRNLLVVLILILSIFIVSCNSKIGNKKKNNSFSKKDSLLLIKDTLIFGKSAEGEEIKLYKNKFTGDSVIITKAYGETGKAVYVFVFNENLINAERVISNYQNSIYKDSKPSINNIIKENLNTSKKIRDELTDIFNDCHSILGYKIKKNIFQNWNGIYSFSLNIFRMNEHHSFDLDIKVNNDTAKLIFSVDGMKTDTIVKGTVKKDKYIITYNQDNQEKEYIIEKKDNSYFISGSSIHMLNPPNEAYALEKIK